MRMKGWLRNAKVASAIGFLILIALLWVLGLWCDWSLETRFLAVLLVMLLWVLTLLVGHAVKSKASNLLEGVLRKQADDAVINAGSEKRAEVTMLRQRLLGAVETLKTSKLGKASGRAALYELPWYMIIGHPAAGKSSAILQSGLTFPFSDKHGVQGVGGTRNCDWFFSTEGILLDTAGRYATQSEDRGEWLEFLKLLKKHRARAPVNGILVAVSLPELTQHQSEGFEIYARQVRERIHEITHTFGRQVPIYLVFTKLDLLSGFSPFFQDCAEEERAQVWGATFNANQGADFDVATVVNKQFELLAKGLVQMGEERLLHGGSQNARSAYFAFPIEFSNLKAGVVRFVRLLTEEDPYHARPLLRGFYFTSALQEGAPRIVAASRIKSLFGIGGGQAGQGGNSAASYSFFLRNLFREVIFPDQHLMANQSAPQRRPWRLAGMAAGLLSLCVICGLWTWSYIGNQNLLQHLAADRVAAHKLAASGELHDKLAALAILQKDLEALQSYRKDGAPWQMGLGLYQGRDAEIALRGEYFAGVKALMLEPVRQNLETTLVSLKQPVEAPAPAPAPVAKPAPEAPKPAVKSKAKVRAKPHGPKNGGGNALPTIQISQYQPVASPYRQVAWRAPVATQGAWWHAEPVAGDFAGFRAMPVADVVPASAATPAVVTPVSPAEGAAASAADNGRQAQLDVAYNALKTYLMLHDSKHMEEAQLSDQLPRYWRPWLADHKGQYTEGEIMPLAERMIAFYVSQIHEPDLPLIDNDPNLVNSARNVLRASFKRLSGPERVFNAIRAQANTRYAPLTVGLILDNHDLDVVAGSQMVEGAFTRQAWNDYVSKAIDDASKGQISGDDWVLATTLTENLGQDGNVDKNRAELTNLYRAQYIVQWKKFLMGVAVRDFANSAQAASAMTRLADPKTSPVKLILVRVAQETNWDNPSELQNTLRSAGKSVLEKTAEFIRGDSGAKPDAQASQYGQVGGYFAGVAQLARGDNPPINGYLDQLAKIKAKLAAMASGDDSGAQAAAALKATLGGSGSELADTMGYVDNTLLAPVSADTREMVRPLLVRPLTQTYSALVGSAAAGINQAWQAEVMPQWRQISGKYPFSNSSNVASVDEIGRFAQSNTGVFDQFVNKHLDGLVQRQGDTLVPRTWGGMGVRFSPAFLSAAPRLAALASAQGQGGDASARFEIQALPTPGLAEIAFFLDGQELHYRNGAQVWQPFNWPGNGQAGARIQALTYSGASVVVGSQTGRMGFLRLLASAKVVQQSGDSALLSWTIKKDGGAVDTVRFNIRSVSGLNPLQLTQLHDLTLPERITM
ncbi:MAG: type VI secretion system membrane subunit TssM [Paludibacterium sp.]|nr:type VI secretion system membrane subunit TssM [Paludibacterium sp.]